MSDVVAEDGRLRSLQERSDALVGYRNPNERTLAMHWTCVCDHEHWVETKNLHAVKCGNCGRSWELSTTIHFQPAVSGFTPVVCLGTKFWSDEGAGGQ
jgi:hypothetical protein